MSNSTKSKKEQVVELIASIESGDHQPMSYINPEKYIQHNLSAADGLQGFAELMKHLPPNSARAKLVRALQDGDIVFTHSEYNFFGPKIGFDIFRFENGKIVEHWDNLQETPASPNQSGHTMIDGTMHVKDIEKTASNKAFVRKFLEEVLVNGHAERLPSYFDGDNYLQHNPQVGDGLTGLGKALQAWARQGIALKFDKVHHVFGEGNFVLAVSEGTLGGKHSSFYDLFRVENGKLAEHWDTIEAIPPKSEWKNANGKF